MGRKMLIPGKGLGGTLEVRRLLVERFMMTITCAWMLLHQKQQNMESSKGNGLLPPPHVSCYNEDGSQQKLKYLGGSIQRMYKTRGRILSEASEWAPIGENFHGRRGQNV